MKILIVLFFLASATLTAAPSKSAAQGDKPPCCRVPLELGKPTDKSLYLLESVWTSDVGRQIKLATLRGRPQILAMFFTHCEYACPILVAELKTIECRLPPEVLGNVDFLLVSLDSKRDMPAELAAFRDQRQLPRTRWTLLHGGADDVRELAALLGVNYAEDARGQFAHTNLITLLNAEGEIAFQHLGLKQDPAPLIAAIQKAAGAAKR